MWQYLLTLLKYTPFDKANPLLEFNTQDRASHDWNEVSLTSFTAALSLTGKHKKKKTLQFPPSEIQVNKLYENYEILCNLKDNEDPR